MSGKCRQWGLQTAKGTTKISLPITKTILIGVVCDGGDWYADIGFNAASGTIYTPGNNVAVTFLVLCK